jgi:hypothetical protein
LRAAIGKVKDAALSESGKRLAEWIAEALKEAAKGG